MKKAKLPHNESERLAALRAYDILDTDPEEAFDDLAHLAGYICDAPMALVSLVDSERQWFKSRIGVSACETSRDIAFCAHTILNPDEVFIVENALSDHRFADNPLVTGELNLRFYAGAPLVTPDGLPLGALCVVDHKPRTLDERQTRALRALARQVVSQLELRKSCIKLRTLAAELNRTNEELKDFTYIAAHDLQEPLRKLVSFSSLLESDLGDGLPERASRDLMFIKRASCRMQQLVSDLLNLSRAGSSPLTREQFSLTECVHTALDALSLKIQETGARITVAELPEVRGDRTLLNQLFQNLISNALKFVSADKPLIQVTCERENGTTVFGVRDNGIGIDPKYIDKIFAPFKRLHGREAYEGSGIGLAIARKAVQRHGGRIWIESEPNEGAHFKFTLSGAHVTSKLPVA